MLPIKSHLSPSPSSSFPFFPLAISQFMSGLLDPPLCSHCNQKRFFTVPLCFGCIKKMEKTPDSCCSLCGLPCCDEVHDNEAFHFDEVRSLFYLEPILKGLIHGFKYHSLKRNGYFLGEYLRLRPSIMDYVRSFDGIIPVPLHTLRKRERGFNQSEIIAQRISRLTGVPVFLKQLKRTRYTITQTKMDSDKRKQNLKGAFQVMGISQIIGKNLLILDDVFTTGSTLNICAEILKKSGAKKVGALTLARVRMSESTEDYAQELAMAGAFVV